MQTFTIVVAVLLLGLVVSPSMAGQGDWWDRTVEALQGARDMYRAYSDMREANWKDSDHYFHARGNYDAAQRGPGGEWAARVISNAREFFPSRSSGTGRLDSWLDQNANEWGRSGRDPNKFRPQGLPDRY